MYATNTIALRESIKKFASDNHLTLTEIAKRAGIYLTSLSRLVSGKTKTVQLETLEKLQAIGVRVDLTSDEDYQQEIVDNFQRSEAAVIVGLWQPLMRIVDKTSDLETITNWALKSPAGQSLFCAGLSNPNEIIARLLAYLHQQGLLKAEMHFPGMRPPLSQKEIRIGMELAKVMEGLPKLSEGQMYSVAIALVKVMKDYPEWTEEQIKAVVMSVPAFKEMFSEEWTEEQIKAIVMGLAKIVKEYPEWREEVEKQVETAIVKGHGQTPEKRP